MAAARTDVFDLGALRLSAGEGRRLELDVPLEDFTFGNERYRTEPRHARAVLDVSRMTSQGYALRLRFATELAGPCMRCLGPAQPSIEVDSREIDQPSGGEEMSSPYVTDEELDVAAWARDALALALPAQILCRPDCAGLCPKCGRSLNDEPHEHEPEPDPRWAKLRELKLD
jgi:uncharacterized protein